MTSRRGRISRKRVQETLAHVRGDPCLLEDLIRFERIKRWTVDLVTKMHPGSRITAYRHLERLVEWGCLGRHKAGGKGGGGSAPAVYYLSALGARVLTHALEQEQPVTYVRRTSRSQEMHDLAMAELAADWGLLGRWRVQSPIPYTRNALIVEKARKYVEAREKYQEAQRQGVILNHLPPNVPGSLRNLHYWLTLDNSTTLPLESWVASVRPIPGRIIPDFWTLVRGGKPGDRDWLGCIEVEGRTEKRHIEDKYWRYVEMKTALPESLALFVVFISQDVARRALPQHRRILNRLLEDTERDTFAESLGWVSFTNLDYLREQEDKGNPFDLTNRATHLWEDGVVRRADEDPWEREERERRERERRAYWAARK